MAFTVTSWLQTRQRRLRPPMCPKRHTTRRPSLSLWLADFLTPNVRLFYRSSSDSSVCAFFGLAKFRRTQVFANGTGFAFVHNEFHGEQEHNRSYCSFDSKTDTGQCILWSTDLATTVNGGAAASTLFWAIFGPFSRIFHQSKLHPTPQTPCDVFYLVPMLVGHWLVLAIRWHGQFTPSRLDVAAPARPHHHPPAEVRQRRRHRRVW